MKKTIILIIILMLSIPAYSAGTGKLTVVTDLGNDATIFIDGTLVGQDSIQAYPLEAGEHYVTVSYRGKKAYAKMLTIADGEFKTITSAHFVDLRTSTPSRGAVDMEASRLRESRGNMAIGLYGLSPAGGLSWKWWFMEKVGVQLVGMLSNNGDLTNNQFGGRVLVHLADKVFNETTITAYVAVGSGVWYATNENGNATNTLIGEGTLGVELGFLNLYWSLEAGVEKRMETHTNDEPSTDRTNMKASGGVHYYF
jgi:hypothetical protein